VSVGKKALIITDASESIQPVAKIISDTLTEFNVKTCTAENFAGTDLLSADIFFIGCENQGHKSFAYLEDMLLHINLVSRKCGIFSINESAIQYLRSMLKDSEADLGEPLLFTENKPAIEDWVSNLLN